RSRSQQRPASSGAGLLREASNHASPAAQRWTGYDIAVAGFGAGGHHADGDETLVLAGGSERRVGGAAEGRGVADRPIGVERQHLGLRVATLSLHRGPDERRSGGGGAGLDQDIIG